ncbi:MAG: SGNH/GDSL hydrolase family protein [Oscillospiraceae bacterium]|nr:SGNH/GDSL hydrolase family protein [Oscillospiraceae bacterium]MDD4413119.1 SGNH/GDSL hydrolase family protein [Oscillospiraceae bacterium]
MKKLIFIICAILMCMTGCMSSDELPHISSGGSSAESQTGKQTTVSVDSRITVNEQEITTTVEHTTIQNKTSITTAVSLSGDERVDAVLNTYSKAELTAPRYDLQKYMKPIWEDSLVYNESVMVLAEENGEVAPITLAYDAAYIVDVRSSSLTTVYKEGKDYRLKGGKLHIPAGSDIPMMKQETYYPATASSNTMRRTEGGYLLFSEGGYFHQNQIAVTYVHLDKWKGEVPATQKVRLKKTVDKLNNKQPLHIVFYGDSIFTGCNASGTTQGGKVLPFMPSWFDMLVEMLKHTFGYENITYSNPSVGGVKSDWGVQNAQSLVVSENPDLLFIGFGMNDAQLSVSTYRQNIEDIMDTVQATNPSCEFILTAPMLPNKEAQGFYGNQVLFLRELQRLCGNGVAIMDLTTPHQYLLTRKSYRDMTGNNVNHPNDFLSRLYAQVALACFHFNIHHFS